MAAPPASESEETNKDAKGNPLDLENYFAVLGKKWNPRTEDHTIPVGGKPESTRFSEVDDALTLFEKMKYADFPDGDGQDVRLDLLHYRFGITHIVKTKILFP